MKFSGKNIKRQGRSCGRIRVRSRGGGIMRRYNFIDQGLYNLLGIPYKVLEIGRKGDRRVALVLFTSGILSNIYVTDGVKKGDILVSFNGERYSRLISNLGSVFSLLSLKVGDKISFIQKYPGSAYIYTKSYGCYGVIIKHIKFLEGTLVKLRSGILKFFYWKSRCFYGSVGNFYFKYDYFHKAGQKRKLGFRPKVRGVAMNPVDHPHGGGEGKTSGGRHPVSPWGQLAKGYKTKKKKRIKLGYLNNFIFK